VRDLIVREARQKDLLPRPPVSAADVAGICRRLEEVGVAKDCRKADTPWGVVGIRVVEQLDFTLVHSTRAGMVLRFVSQADADRWKGMFPDRRNLFERRDALVIVKISWATPKPDVVKTEREVGALTMPAAASTTP
jgi:hypothetical protein